MDAASVRARREKVRALAPVRAVDDLRDHLRAAAADPVAHIFTVIIVAAAVGGFLLVLADMYQRWVGSNTWTLNVDGRFNAVTWFHSFVLAGASMSALGLAVSAVAGDAQQAKKWLFIGISFAFLSFDKSIAFHERLGQKIEEAFELSDEAGRILWQMLYAPFLVLVVIVLYRLMPAKRFYRRAVLVGVGLCGVKLLLEALMVPAIELGLTSETGVFYGLEVNIEESVQLMGFAVFFATLASLVIRAFQALNTEPPPA